MIWTNIQAFGQRRSLAADARDAILLGVCFLALDWASYIYPLGPFNITPWNPPPALSIVWMLLGGLRYAPVVFVAILAGEFLIRDATAGILLSIVTSLVLAAGYTGIVAALRLRFKFDGRLHNAHQLWILIAVTAVGTAIVGVFYVGVLWSSGFVSGYSFTTSVFQFWLGDTIGVLVTAPLLMVAADPTGRRNLINSFRKPETALQFTALFGLIFYVFQSGSTPQQFFYLLFLPLIWIALRNGLSGAVAASGVVQVGVVLGAQIGALQSLAVVELQALVSALTLTGLALGIIVDERERTAEDLKRSLRLVAAGEMAGAIAHEINQPLAALRNYVSACQILLRQGNQGARHSELDATVVKILHESTRAAEVVRRLRDFFGDGTMRLESVKVCRLLESTRVVGQNLNESGDVAFYVESNASDSECTVLVDQVQIELVLRNLIANAFDAVAGLTQERKKVTVSTRRLKRGRIVIRVTDTGDGISPLVRQRLFEPFTSNKATGMGIGLAISRNIVSAHGGLLRAGDTAHGEFDLVLPIEDVDD
jgi:two-component system, LuxR family, sensor kinase FixL